MTTNTAQDRSVWTTVVATNPSTGVSFVARRFDTEHAAERACELLRRGGFPARCERWRPSDFPGRPWKALENGGDK